MTRTDLLRLCQRLGLTAIPLNPGSKEPLVRWGNGWKPSTEELQHSATRPGINWAVRGGPEVASLDFDSADFFTALSRSIPKRTPGPR
jgi:hypothetical protein